MTELEKVIKGLEECLSASCRGFKPGVYCPVPDETWNYIRNALALLKAQEPVEERLNLCDSCTKEFAECDADKSDLVFGSGIGNDNIIGCSRYTNRWKAQEPVEPKKVKRYIDFDGEGQPYTPETYDCGACGKELPWKANYCPMCGRAVKWE